MFSTNNSIRYFSGKNLVILAPVVHRYLQMAST